MKPDLRVPHAVSRRAPTVGLKADLLRCPAPGEAAAGRLSIHSIFRQLLDILDNAIE